MSHTSASTTCTTSPTRSDSKRRARRALLRAAAGAPRRTGRGTTRRTDGGWCRFRTSGRTSRRRGRCPHGRPARASTSRRSPLEDHVARQEVLGVPDPLRGRHLARHLEGRAAAEHGRERGRTGERLELEDPPDEAGAVEAAGRRLAERLLARLGRAAPDVRVADEGDGAGEHVALERAQLRQEQRLGLGADRVLLPAGEVEQPGERVRGLGARGRVVQAELERVVAAGWLKRRPSRRATSRCRRLPWAGGRRR